MIDAVMYGMMPRANTATRLSAPPENRLRKPTTPPAPLLKKAVEGLDVDARHRHVRAEPVDGQHRRGEQELLAQLRDLPGVGQRLPELVVHVRAPLRFWLD